MLQEELLRILKVRQRAIFSAVIKLHVRNDKDLCGHLFLRNMVLHRSFQNELKHPLDIRVGHFIMARIRSCELLEEYDPGAVTVLKGRLKALTLLLHDERNGLERVLLHFSHFEKETQKLDDWLYRITLRYDQDDETELLIRVLSFGLVLEVVAPITFRQLMRNRIQKQALYAARGISQ